MAALAVTAASAAPTPLPGVDAPAPGASWSSMVIDCADGAVLHAHAAERPLLPASNQKLFTAAAALLSLGPDFRPYTEVLAEGQVADGILHGNLLFHGRGAVHFTARHVPGAIPRRNAVLARQLDAFAQHLRDAGIQRIRGRLIADSSDWTDRPENSRYPSAAPLSFHENTIDITVADGVIRHAPAHAGVFTLITDATVPTQAKLTVQGRVTDVIRVNPARPSDDYWRLDATPAAIHYLAQLRHGLQRRGLVIDGHFIPRREPDPIVRLPGIPTADLIAAALRHSDNFRAEILLLLLVHHHAGNASDHSGATAIRAALHRAGLDLTGYVPADGCGLSRDNRAAAGHVVRLLRHLANSPRADPFRHALATPGRPGTLRSRLLTPPLPDRVHAKTGTLRDVHALSGLLTTDGGRTLAFAFLCNGPHHRERTWAAFEQALRHLCRRH